MANRKKEVYKPKPMTEGKRNLIQGLLQEYDIQSAEDIQEALKDLLSGTPNRKKEVYKPKPMTEGKRNLIQGLLQEYDIQSAEDIQEALKDLLSGTLQDMLETEMEKPMTEGKRNLIQGLLQEYDIQSAEDIQEALKDLLSGTLQDMLETEMDNHLGYDRYERSGEPNYRNGTKSKTVRSKYGEFEVDVPQDRQSSFEPQVLPKRQKDSSAIDDKIISMYAKGMTTRQISETIEYIYGFEVSEGMVSDITDKLLPKIEEWQNRPLSPVYPIVFIDAVRHLCIQSFLLMLCTSLYVMMV